MATKRKKSPARSWQQKSPNHDARSLVGSREATMKSDLQHCAQPAHQVHLQQDEHSRNTVSEWGASPRISQRILLSAIKNMVEKLENIINILTPRSLETEWSTEKYEGDADVMANLQHQLDAAKDDNCKVTAILEHVLASRNKMQAALDAVQTELEHKDTEISKLRKDKSQTQQKMQKLEIELERCQAKVAAMERQHSSQVEPLCKALETARTDKKKLVRHLAEVLQVNDTLQSKLIQTQCELRSKETAHQQLMTCWEQLMQKAKTEEKLYAEHLKSLKKQFQIEQEVSRKAACQESAEKSLEKSSSKLAEVSHAKEELQQKVTELEKSLPCYMEKLKSQRGQVRQCLVCKASTERVKEQDIQKLLSELRSGQSEVQARLRKQREVQAQSRQRETQLETQRRQRQQLENECRKLQKTVKYLKKYKEDTEEQLKEASRESEQITTSLEAAQHWFKTKFDSLQLEAVKNQQPKNPEGSSSEKFLNRSRKQTPLLVPFTSSSFAKGHAQTAENTAGEKSKKSFPLTPP